MFGGLRRKIEVYKLLKEKFKVELAHVKKEIEFKNKDSFGEIKPLLDEFHKKLREIFAQESNLNY